MNKEKKEEKYCGECCWFHGEDSYGNGFCAEAKGEAWGDSVRCDQKCKFSRGGCDNPCFVSQAQMRHHMAVLLQANRYRRDDHVPAVYRMPDQKELGSAIDFAVEYMRVFGEL